LENACPRAEWLAGMNYAITPGSLVRHPSEPDWGLGQVQSVIGSRVTVNFQGAGKVLINAERIELIVVESEDR